MIYSIATVALIFGVLFLIFWATNEPQARHANRTELRRGLICLMLALICYGMTAWGIVPPRYAVWIADKDNAIVIDATTYRAYEATGISSIKLTRTEAQNLNADRVREIIETIIDVGLGAEERSTR